MNEQKELPRYKCLKTVWALKIKFINPQNNSMIVEEEGYAPIQVDKAYFAKHQPHVGGYFVVYKDGYQSFSPADAFEEGYAKISE